MRREETNRNHHEIQDRWIFKELQAKADIEHQALSKRLQCHNEQQKQSEKQTDKHKYIYERQVCQEQKREEDERPGVRVTESLCHRNQFQGHREQRDERKRAGLEFEDKIREEEQRKSAEHGFLKQARLDQSHDQEIQCKERTGVETEAKERRRPDDQNKVRQDVHLVQKHQERLYFTLRADRRLEILRGVEIDCHQIRQDPHSKAKEESHVVTKCQKWHPSEDRIQQEVRTCRICERKEKKLAGIENDERQKVQDEQCKSDGKSSILQNEREQLQNKRRTCLGEVETRQKCEQKGQQQIDEETHEMQKCINQLKDQRSQEQRKGMHCRERGSEEDEEHKAESVRNMQTRQEMSFQEQYTQNKMQNHIEIDNLEQWSTGNEHCKAQDGANSTKKCLENRQETSHEGQMRTEMDIQEKQNRERKADEEAQTVQKRREHILLLLRQHKQLEMQKVDETESQLHQRDEDYRPEEQAGIVQKCPKEHLEEQRMPHDDNKRRDGEGQENQKRKEQQIKAEEQAPIMQSHQGEKLKEKHNQNEEQKRTEIENDRCQKIKDSQQIYEETIETLVNGLKHLLVQSKECREQNLRDVESQERRNREDEQRRVEESYTIQKPIEQRPDQQRQERESKEAYPQDKLNSGEKLKAKEIIGTEKRPVKQLREHHSGNKEERCTKIENRTGEQERQKIEEDAYVQQSPREQLQSQQSEQKHVEIAERQKEKEKQSRVEEEVDVIRERRREQLKVIREQERQYKEQKRKSIEIEEKQVPKEKQRSRRDTRAAQGRLYRQLRDIRERMSELETQRSEFFSFAGSARLTVKSEPEVTGFVRQFLQQQLDGILERQRHRLRLMLPGVCGGHNSAQGCQDPNCENLHICRQFLADVCSDGRECRYGHSLTTVHNQVRNVARCMMNSIMPSRIEPNHLLELK